MEDLTIHDKTDNENPLDFMCEKYKHEDLLTIIWTKTDDEGFHHFEIVLRSKSKPE
jgi:hypothetical protein